MLNGPNCDRKSPDFWNIDSTNKTTWGKCAGPLDSRSGSDQVYCAVYICTCIPPVSKKPVRKTGRMLFGVIMKR